MRSTSLLAVTLLACLAGGPLAVHAQSPEPSAVILPAGAQLPVDGEALPEGFQLRDPSLVAGRDGTIVVLGTSGGDEVRAGTPTVAIRAPEGTWSTSVVDDLAGYRPPPGMTASDGFWPVAIAAGPAGFAALGRNKYFTACARSCAQEGRVVSLIWLSEDGRAWRRVDPRSILGSRSAPSLSSVIPAADGGWIVAGSTTTNLRKPTSLVVLRSPDGREWSLASTIRGPRSLEAGRLLDVGGSLVLEGVELPCVKDSLHHALAAGARGDTLPYTIQQLRAWRADGASGDWTPLDLAATGVIDVPPRQSIRPRDCARHQDGEVQSRLRGTGRLVGAAGDRLLAVDGDVTMVATSGDLATWTAAVLPGAVPGDQTSADRGVRSLTPMAGPDGSLTLLSVENRRDPTEDWVNVGAEQTLAWRTADDGATWERLPAARPYFTRPVDALSTDPLGAHWASCRT